MDILLLGSSLAKCTLGVDWTKQIDATKFTIHNFGINGVQVPGVIEQMRSKSIKLFCKPSVVILIVGGNDVTASFKEMEGTPGYEKIKAGRCNKPPSSPEQFKADMDELLGLIENEYKVPIGVLNIKIYGEDVNGKLNDQIRTFNTKLSELIEKRQFAHLIDLYTPCVELASRAINDMRGVVPMGSDDIKKIVDPSRMVSVFLWNKLTLGFYSLNKLGEHHGLYSTCDGSHFNERSAAIVAKLVSSFLESHLLQNS